MNYGVVTICRNAADTIERSLRSVFSQEVPPAQYFVVDGGSTDGTAEKLEFLAKEAPSDCDFRVIDQPAPSADVAGIPNAWNLGLRELHANIVLLLNADDWLDSDASTIVLAEFDADDSADLLISPIRVVEGSTSRVLKPRPLFLLPFLMPVMHPGCFVRRHVYDRVGAFNERYRISADYDFIYRCRLGGLKFRRYDKPLVSMQWGGAARQNLETARKETLEIARRHCRLPGLPYVAYFLRRMLGR